MFGLVLAAISYFWYYAAVVIARRRPRLSRSVSGSSTGFGVIDPGGPRHLIGLIVGAIFAIGTFMLGVPILLVMVFSAFSGAAAVVNGVLILFGTIKLATIDERHLRLALQAGRSSAPSSGSSSPRRRSSTRCATSASRSPSIDRSAYRYS